MKKHIILIGSIISFASACAKPVYNYSAPVTNDSVILKDQRSEIVSGNELQTDVFQIKGEGIFLPSTEKFNFYSFSSGFYPKVGEDNRNTYYSFEIGDGKNPTGKLGTAKKAPLVDRVKNIAIPKKDLRFCIVTYYNFRNCTNAIEFEVKRLNGQD